MKHIKIAGANLNQTPLDWAGNLENILSAIDLAKNENVSVLCLPELCISGYGCEDAFFNPHVLKSSLDMLSQIAPKTIGMVVTVGLPMFHRGAIYNVTAILVNGNVSGFIPKKALAGDGVHYETRWFKAWEYEICDQITYQLMDVPFGDYHFEVGGVKIGFEICEEAWIAHRPGAALAQKAVDIILNPSASHFAFGKSETRKRFVCEGSRAFGVAYVYANLLGNESGRVIFDGGTLISTEGRIVAQGERFSYKLAIVTSAVIDVEVNRMVRAKLASFKPTIKINNQDCIKIHMEWVKQLPQKEDFNISQWEKSPDIKKEEFARAVSLGLFDFLRKSRQSGFAISLSGGVDSAVVAILSHLALKFAEQEIGLSGLKGRLHYIPAIQGTSSLREISNRLIFCAYQGTENSSVETELAAKEIAGAIDSTFYDWSVDSLVKEYVSLVGKAMNKAITWDENDIALQNIQARVRGPAIWLLANLNNTLLLATSNRSEAAVGYATMDGDTCGGLSPIGGIDKAFLKEWCHWMMTSGPEGIGLISQLRFVLQKAPTAELRPQALNQTDEKDLMPYDVLDQIEKLAIRDKKSPLEIYTVLTSLRSEIETENLKAWITKFFRLWCRNQWKRERYAPAFHLDDESLDPKTWCRFPILSSGFESELIELKRMK